MHLYDVDTSVFATHVDFLTEMALYSPMKVLADT